MADSISKDETDSNKKRPRSLTSSTSEMETTMNTTPIKNPKKKQNKQKGDNNANETNDTGDMKDMKDIKHQLTQINEKLANVMTKDDNTLKQMIKDTITEMKTSLLQSVEKQIQVLEGKIFEKDQQNDKLHKRVTRLEKTIEEIDNDKDNLKRELRRNEAKTDDYLNEMEQYSRINNVRISGIKEEGFPIHVPEAARVTSNDKSKGDIENAALLRGKYDEIATTETKTYSTVAKAAHTDKRPENADETTSIVIKTLNKHIPHLNLKKDDIDISHRQTIWREMETSDIHKAVISRDIHV